MAGFALGQCEPQWRGYEGPYLDAPVFALTTWDPDGAGPQGAVVIAAGNFHNAGSTALNFVGMWNGAEWSPMGAGVSGTVDCATLYDPDGSGLQPVIGGGFSLSGATAVNRIARFDGAEWVPFGEGVSIPGSTFNTTVYSLGVVGSWLVAGGIFTQAGTVPAEYAARWDGQSWHAFDVDVLGIPHAFLDYGGSLLAGGYFVHPSVSTARTGVLRWAGMEWQTLGENFPRRHVYSLATYSGDLYAGGTFTDCCGNPPGPSEYIARFDGAIWHPVGTGLNGGVEAMIVFDDGTGPKLFVGGGFDMAAGVSASGIASWDGAQWRALGSGTAGRVRAFTIWRNQLVVGGEFWSAGGIVSPGMAIWGCEAPVCYPNCDASTVAPALNVDDFLCFINEFAAGMGLPQAQQVGHYANCDGSATAPVLNVDDFTCFINAFAAGCR